MLLRLTLEVYSLLVPPFCVTVPLFTSTTSYLGVLSYLEYVEASDMRLLLSNDPL